MRASGIFQRPWFLAIVSAAFMFFKSSGLPRRRGGVLASLVLVLLTLGLMGAAQAAVTSLTLESEPGDFIGGGHRLFFSGGDGSFTAQQYYLHGVLVFFN